jgi:pyruvate dehydrogenase E2 component (dihydrolipoamide acetyltransferase)
LPASDARPNNADMPTPEPAAPEADRHVAHNRIRRATIRAVDASVAVPQFRLEREADTAGLARLRSRMREQARAPTVSDFLVAACAHALRAHPELNASYAEDGIVVHGRVHVGSALAIEAGLVVAAIIDADRHDLDALAVERRRLQDAARTSRLTPFEVRSTTFTISNLGPLGVTRFTALVIPPQAAILAVGSAGDRLTLGLSCDHRVVDGAPAARFLAELADRLEHPEWMDER